MDDILDLDSPEYQKLVDQAATAIDENQIAVSNPKATPIFVWSKRALTNAQVRDAVEASGNSPYRFKAGWPLPDRMVWQVPGKPVGFTFGWLLVVEIKARLTHAQTP